VTALSFLAALGAMALVRIACLAFVAAFAAARAYRAVSMLVGRTYWSPDLVMAYQATFIEAALADDHFHPAAGDRSVITRRLPRGWVPTGRVIDVEVRS
jgi:hypothetical protein